MMRKPCLLTALLAAVALAASSPASAESWNFTYQGFLNMYTGEFEAGKTLAGSFEAEDRNHDNVITFDELSTLTLDGNTYTNQASSDCGVWPGYCHLSQFSYSLTGQLSFAANYQKHFEDPGVDENGVYESGSYFYTLISTPGGNITDYYEWTDRTTLTITPPPVPEPATGALWLTGAAVVGAALRRRRP